MNSHKSNCVSHAYVPKGWILEKQGSKNRDHNRKLILDFRSYMIARRSTVVRYQEM